MDFAEKLRNKTKGHPVDSTDRLSRNTVVEVSRIKLLEGFSLFVSDEQSKISENDLYSYLGITVRTSKSIFTGRVKSIKSMIQELGKNTEDQLYEKIIQYHKFLFYKYQQTMKYFMEK